jgi:rhomboid protease GluP
VDKVQLGILAAIVVIALSSAWVYRDARKHRIPTHGYAYTVNTGAGAWLLGCLVLWIVVFPAYLIRRNDLLQHRLQRARTLTECDPQRSEPVELSADDPALEGSDPWDLVAIGRAQRLRGLASVSLAPDISPAVMHRALEHYLRLEPGELLLAIIDPTLGKRPGQAYALTTRQIHWLDPNCTDRLAKRANQGITPGLGLGRAGLDFAGLSIPYTSLGGRVAAAEPAAAEAGDSSPAVAVAAGPGISSATSVILDLAGSRKVDLGVLQPESHDSLRDYLQAVGPAARQERPMLGRAMAEEARCMLPVLKQQSARLLAEAEDVKDFQMGLKSAIRRAIVTPAFLMSCLAVFVAMVLKGVSPVEPSIDDLLAWGANYGPFVAVDHEYWRLFTSMFLHVGFLHLFFNMWCLMAAGPIIERFFGHLGFAAIYVLSGLGGAVASMAVHPMMVSAGASGAIFGIFGALLGFLAVQHLSVPAALLKPLRTSATSFVAYSILFGMMSAKVDNSAHLGGLATGFLCGLLLYRRLPSVAGRQGLIRRLVATAGLAAGLLLATLALSDTVAGNPQIRTASHVNDHLAKSYNQLAREIEKPTMSHERIVDEMNQLLERLSKTDKVEPGDPDLADRLVAQAEAEFDTVERVSLPDPELATILDALITSSRDLRDALRLLRKSLVESDEARREATLDSFQQKLTESDRAAGEFIARRDKFLQAHGFVLQNADPAARPAGDNGVR